MTANQAMFAISSMCKTLGVSRAGYYAWRDRAPCERALADAALMERIKRSIGPPGRAMGRHVSTLNLPMRVFTSVASGSSD